MKTIVDIGKRFRQLIIKLLGVKGILAVTAWISFLVRGDEFSMQLVVLFSVLFVGGREFDKVLDLIRALRGMPRVEM